MLHCHGEPAEDGDRNRIARQTVRNPFGQGVFFDASRIQTVITENLFLVRPGCHEDLGYPPANIL